jgi:hypothetical protein
MTVPKLPINYDEKFILKLQNLNPNPGTVVLIEGKYRIGDIPPARLFFVKNNISYEAALSQRLRDIRDNDIVEVSGVAVPYAFILPSGREWTINVIDVEKFKKIDVYTSYEDVLNITGKYYEKIVKDLTAEAEKKIGYKITTALIKDVIWDSERHQWIVSYLWDRPYNVMGSVAYFYVDPKSGEIKNVIISKTTRPVLE